jgi:hypothetical protein
MRGSLRLSALILVSLLPYSASAVTLLDTLNLISVILNAAVGMFVTLAIVIFFWGLIKYLANTGEQKSEGLKIMYYGVMTIFVMVSLWGIVRLLQNTFQVTSTDPVVPQGIHIDLGRYYQ